MNIKPEELEDKLTELLNQAADARDKAQAVCTEITNIKNWLSKEQVKQLKNKEGA